jgi:hypothetical protein
VTYWPTSGRLLLLLNAENMEEDFFVTAIRVNEAEALLIIP